MVVVKREDLPGSIIFFIIITVILGLLIGLFPGESLLNLDEPLFKESGGCYSQARLVDRGAAKQSINNHKGAVALFTKALELDCTNNGTAYFLRGISKESLGDLTGACADWKKATASGLHKRDSKYAAKKCN
tara:strand:- start:46 stop:441 length:396 start_codon:yes stop_codon:yes gene_type:complete